LTKERWTVDCPSMSEKSSSCVKVGRGFLQTTDSSFA
jgi:hypothetical protein